MSTIPAFDEGAFLDFIHHIPDYAFFLLDAKGCLTHWSESAETLFGYSADELRGKHMSFLYPQSDKGDSRNPESELQMAAAHGRFEDTYWRARRDGSRFWAECVICPLRGSDGELRGFTKIVRDINERRKAELLLRQKEAELEQARKMEAIGRLVGGVAHDFNNFITGIIGLAEEIHDSMDGQDARRADAADIIKLANRASALTRELLAFSRKQTSAPQVVSLNAAIAEKKKILLRLIGGAGIAFDMKLDPNLGHVLIDPRQFDQILVNLVMNARDAMSQGGHILIETRREVLAQPSEGGLPSGPYAMLRISDTGTGMEPEVMKNIFEPFFTTKKMGKGTGLGLSTVYGIVKQHHGDIQVTSALGEGTTFTILWPEIDAPAKMTPADPSTPTPLPPRTETILLTEDEDAVRQVARRALERSGYRVLVAASGAEALLLAETFKGPIHLLITDILMPEMNGRSLADQFHRFHPKTPVLYMSAYSEDIIHQRGVLVDGLEFIEKPFTQESLNAKVVEILDKVRVPNT